MRFIADGPSIPDDLLVARDEGRVVFFCGAGVSRARARLPDFYRLTAMVLDRLGAIDGSPARRLMETVSKLRDFDGVPEIGTLVSADRIFGLLEREFPQQEIRLAVAEALRPPEDADLTAHRILLDLSRGPDGTIRLVTTNFDRLFEAAAPDLRHWQPPQLPDLRRQKAFDGIVHLHGIVNQTYSGIAGEEFVVSSADFGHAYLADGWAANFMRQLLQRFQLVFVGYGADDPPVQYLLEALGRTATGTAGIYAFHGGPAEEAQARWGAKGVIPIPFGDDFATLWATLEAWAARAVDPEGWIRSVIALARQGPGALTPHERGQVAHLVSTVPGARAFASADEPPPADWLCVFDPATRFTKPGRLGRAFEAGSFFDPFDVYGLDGDPVPDRIAPDDPYAKRDAPPDAWSAFEVTPAEQADQALTVAFSGHRSQAPAPLPPRLWHLATWLDKVCHQPAAPWWAGGQDGLHPAVRRYIQHELARDPTRFPPAVREAWRMLLAAWRREAHVASYTWYDLTYEIQAEGWSARALEAFADLIRPRLKVERPIWSRRKPPDDHSDIDLDDLVSVQVNYPYWERDLPVPDERVGSAVGILRRLLEDSVLLERELDGYGLRLERPLVPDTDLPDDRIDHVDGLGGLLLTYVGYYRRLAALDPRAARAERRAWPEDDGSVFARLRMWVAGEPDITDAKEAGSLLREVPDDAFWDDYHQRDLLMAMKARWGELSDQHRSALVARILRGPAAWEAEPRAEFRKRRARRILTRVTWLEDNGCPVPSARARTERLRAQIPEWQPDHAVEAAASLESRGGHVKTDDTPDLLKDVPLDTLIAMAEDLRGRDPRNHLLEYDPFQGFVTIRPVRALAGLMIRTRARSLPIRPWMTFLRSDARRNDPPRRAALIAARLATLPEEALTSLVHEVTSWLRDAAKSLLTAYPNLFWKLWELLIDVLRDREAAGRSAVAHSRRTDWVFHAINAPAGRLADALLDSPSLEGLTIGGGLPATWTARAEEVLALSGDLRRHVLAVFGRRLRLLFAVDPDWTERHILPAAAPEGEDGPAFWDGFFGGGAIDTTLFQRLKPALLEMVPGAVEPGGQTDRLGALLLIGWAGIWEGGEEPCVSDQEMHAALVTGSDAFRTHVLFLLARRCRGAEGGAWKAKVLPFLRSVWPRQLAANGPAVTAGLCDLLLGLDDEFPLALETVLPRLSPLDRDASRTMHDLDDLEQPEGNLLERFPAAVLALLHRVLPDDVDLWPYNIRAVLDRIATQAPELSSDERLLLLRRRLDGRA